MANTAGYMSYSYLKELRLEHLTWRLLAASKAPLVISFLYGEFVEENQREIAEHVLLQRLDSYMEEAGIADDFASAKELLAQWADEEHGYLRKFYPANHDEVHYDLTSSAQKAIEWIASLKTESFVGTESRLILIFQLLHEIAEQSNQDPARRLKELERKKAELEHEIALAKDGVVKVLQPVQIKERFMQAMQMSREILADFRVVEQNFRKLNREMREKIAGWEKGKGELLESFFYTHDGIYQSEQGKSFQAFFDFLMSRAAQDDFEEIVAYVSGLEPVKGLSGAQNARRIVRDWVAGSKHVQTTVASISEQLRRYVDENFLEEERRISQIMKQIEASAIAICNEEKPQGVFLEINHLSPEIMLPFDRPLFTPPVQMEMIEADLTYGSAEEHADHALYSHISVDKELLKQHIRDCLTTQQAVTLAQIAEAYPIRLGLAELVTYLVIARGDWNAIIDTEISEPVLWKDKMGMERCADLGRVIYTKEKEPNG